LSTGTSAPATDGRLVFATVGAVALNTILRTIIVTMLLLILGMGPLRILDGAHWPSDVLAGYALGLAWTITVLAIGLPWAAGQKQTEDYPGSARYRSGY